MADFRPKLAQPGETIRADDWNAIQQGLLTDIQNLEAAMAEMKHYVDNMSETLVIKNLESVEGKSYGLNDPVPGEIATYQTHVLGLITRQWIPSRQGAAVICKYGLTDRFDVMYYWAGAEKGNKKTLEVTIEYVEGTKEVIKDLFVHDRAKLAPKGADNPYSEYLLSPNQLVWYRYSLTNPRPDIEVRYLTFRNTSPECTTRVGNAIHLKVKIQPMTGRVTA